jgi:anti-sigma regulatory factor (Ser/Thr protein kinase)
MADTWSRGILPRWAVPGDTAEGLVLDQVFDAETLHELRKAVLAAAVAAGMPDDRAAQVMLAVHELAANSVCHGGGAGRARMSIVGGDLHCQVSDAGQGGDGQGGDGLDRGEGEDAAAPWTFQRGHGLWVVRKVADHVSVAASLGDSQVIAVFGLPGFRGGATGQ